MIIVKGLKKYYNRNLVLDIDYFNFKEGKVYLLLGGNGSGKSTFIKSIIGLIKYEGLIKKNCKCIGYVPERFPEISLIKVESFLDNLVVNKEKTIRGEIIRQFSSFFELDIKKNLCELSKGNLQKLMIIQALINNADVFIFDEALNGLDKKNQLKLIDIIRILKDNNKTVIITSHYPDYYLDFCDNIVYLKQGKIYEYKENY